MLTRIYVPIWRHYATMSCGDGIIYSDAGEWKNEVLKFKLTVTFDSVSTPPSKYRDSHDKTMKHGISSQEKGENMC